MDELKSNVFDGLPFGIVVIDNHNHILTANQFFMEWCMDDFHTYKSAYEIMGQNLDGLLSAKHVDQILELAAQFEISSIDIDHRVFARSIVCQRGGSPKTYRVSITKYDAPSVPKAAFVIIWQQLGERTFSESFQLADARSRLEVARQLAASLNHEINNPLFVVSATLEDLLAECSDDDQAGRIQSALEAVWRAAASVKQLQEIRQIVTTDYVEGLLMVDLEASTGRNH